MAHYKISQSGQGQQETVQRGQGDGEKSAISGLYTNQKIFHKN